jgi:nucleotide-binding universal stress UspA family protein
MHILAATDFSTRSNRAVRQAGLLAQPGNSQLHIVHVAARGAPSRCAPNGRAMRTMRSEAEKIAIRWPAHVGKSSACHAYESESARASA